MSNESDPEHFETYWLISDGLLCQIDPSVVQEFKFSCNIEAYLHDRLPQLICNSCIDSLRKYVEGTREFLKELISDENVTVSSDSLPEPESNEDCHYSLQLVSDETDNEEDTNSSINTNENDPNRFVAYRLSIENGKSYLIDRSLLQEIKFCSDMEAHLHDRLPKLMDIRCLTLLRRNVESMEKFLNSQFSDENDTESTQSSPETISDSTEDSLSSSPQLISDEMDEEEGWEQLNFSSIKSTEAPTATKNAKRQKLLKKPIKDSWKTEYDKFFKCRFCNKSFETRCGITMHIKTHRSLLHKYHTYIDKNCSVNLKKLDNKPNLCNSEQIVVHNMRKCIRSDDIFYYTLYKPKGVRECCYPDENQVIYNYESS